MPHKVNIGGDSEFDLRVAISYTLLVLTLTVEPPVFDSDAIAKPSLSLQEVFICQGFSYPPLVEPGV